MSTTNALSNSFLRLGLVVLAVFLASCGVRMSEVDPGAGSNRPFGCAVFDNAVYFSAFDATSGFELWKSDGTEAGTVRVKDINPGPGGSSPFGFTILNDALYFSADDGSNGFELWKSDGTAAGTVRVNDISRVNVPQAAGGTLNSASLRPKVSWQSCKPTFAWTGAKPGTQSDKRRRMKNGIQHQNSSG
jgi:ELWxxDGT repeat protein